MLSESNPLDPPCPDVYIFVMDCVRAKSLRPWDAGGIDLPSIDSFAKSSTLFTRCLSVASWSLPSHASIFTGLYPWHHEVFGGARRFLAVETPTMAGRLQGSGYRTISLSANPFVSTRTGLTNGFGSAYWGDWASHYLRFLGSRLPPEGYAGSDVPEGTISLQPVSHRMGLNLVNAIQPATRRLWKFGNVARARTCAPDHRPLPNSAPWVEPSLEAWLAATPQEVPVSCFVNLMDAHEPYLGSDYTNLAAHGSERYLIDSFDNLDLRLPSSKEILSELERRYVGSLRSLDGRLGRLMSMIRKHRPLDSALIILTSDHGQAFGEEGSLFHAPAVSEELMRVPLAVHFPGGANSGLVSPNWTSLVDIAPTVCEAAGLGSGMHMDGESLRKLVTEKRSQPVFGLGDGNSGRNPSPGRASRPGPASPSHSILGVFEDLQVRAEDPEWRPEVRASNDGDKWGTPDAKAGPSLSPTQLAQVLSVVGSLMRSSRRPSGEERTVARLSSWGY